MIKPGLWRRYHFMATKNLQRFYGKFIRLPTEEPLRTRLLCSPTMMMSACCLEITQWIQARRNYYVSSVCYNNGRKASPSATRLMLSAISLYNWLMTHTEHILSVCWRICALQSSDMATKLLMNTGVDKSIIYPLGIWFLDRFTEPFDKEAICDGPDPATSLSNSAYGRFFQALQACWAFYWSSCERAPKCSLLSSPEKHRSLQPWKGNWRNGYAGQHKAFVLCKHVEDYMHISDLIVTKLATYRHQSPACSASNGTSTHSRSERDNATFYQQGCGTVSWKRQVQMIS